jgi:hypothetical protein
MASLLDDTGDIDDALLFAEPVPFAKDPLNLTANECRLRLLHVQIKQNATVPSNPGFKALPRANPPRPAKLRLPKRFENPDIQRTPLEFFRLFIGDEIIDTLVQNTNAKALSECAGLEGRHWSPIDRHELSIWIGLNIYIGLHGNCDIKDYWQTQGQAYYRPMQCMPYYRFT